jgi:hypothetical protein
MRLICYEQLKRIGFTTSFFQTIQISHPKTQNATQVGPYNLVC